MQLAPLRDYLSPFLEPDTDRVRVLIPACTLPKRPLLSFRLSVDEGNAYLLNRASISELQVSYIVKQMEIEGMQPPDPRLVELLRVMSEFSSGYWRRRRDGLYRGQSKAVAIRKYVLEATGIETTDAYFDYLHHRALAVGRILRDTIKETADPYSASDDFFLALPLLNERRPLYSEDDLYLAVRLMEQFVTEAVTIGATNTLLAVGEYGRRYEAIVECELSVDQPATLRIEHDLPLDIKARGRVQLDQIFGDCLTNHLMVKVEDPDVELVQRTPKDGNGKKLTGDVFTHARTTREDVAVYGAEYNREYLIGFCFRLVTTRMSRASVAGLVAITTVSALLSLTYRPITSQELAVFVVPTTLASGILLTQARTSLAARLQRAQRIGVLFTVMALWAIVVFLYTGDVVKPSP